MLILSVQFLFFSTTKRKIASTGHWNKKKNDLKSSTFFSQFVPVNKVIYQEAPATLSWYINTSVQRSSLEQFCQFEALERWFTQQTGRTGFRTTDSTHWLSHIMLCQQTRRECNWIQTENVCTHQEQYANTLCGLYYRVNTVHRVKYTTCLFVRRTSVKPN